MDPNQEEVFMPLVKNDIDLAREQYKKAMQ